MDNLLKALTASMPFILVIAIITIVCCACSAPITDDLGIERETIYERFAIIEESNGLKIVYDIHTKVVYYYNPGEATSFCTPYLIYKNGAVYGAIFEKGEIKPVPYSSTPLI